MDMIITVDLRGLDTTGLDDKLKAVVTIASRNVEKDAKQRMANWPAVDTGDTMGSIFVDPGTPSMEQRVGPTTDYAPFVEFGTVYMRARPFMIPALERESKPFIDAITQVIERFGRK